MHSIPSSPTSPYTGSRFSPTGKRLTRINASINGTQASGLGIVIVGGYKEGEEFGIFVKSVRPNGPVAQDGQSNYMESVVQYFACSMTI